MLSTGGYYLYQKMRSGPTMAKKKVAIVGSGVSGLGALWALKDTKHEIHLFESEARLGGHTNTVEFKAKIGQVPVDTGFIVLNTATYRT